MAGSARQFYLFQFEIRKRPLPSEEIHVEDFPIWLKLFIWGTIALTVGYTVWGMLQSVMQP